MKKYFAKNLTFLRKKNNKTQTDIALQVNKSQRIVSNWEREETEPSLEEIGIISDYFGIKAHDLIFSDLSNDSLNISDTPAKNNRNDSLIDSGNDSLNQKKEVYSLDLSDEEQRKVEEETANYRTNAQLREIILLQQQNIGVLQEALNDKNTIIAQLTAEQERLKRDIASLENAIPAPPQLKTSKQEA